MLSGVENIILSGMSPSIASRTVEQAAEEFFALAKLFPDKAHREVEDMCLAVGRYEDRSVAYEDHELIVFIDRTAARLWDLMLEKGIVISLEKFEQERAVLDPKNAVA